ncbi:MAG: hypothetical protein R3D00_30830 [Bacteroidia bacterium]
MRSGHTVCINLPIFSRRKTPLLFSKLGFVPLGKDLLGQTLVTDGTVIVRLDEESEYGAGLLYFAETVLPLPVGDSISDEVESEWAMEWQSPEGVSLTILQTPHVEMPNAPKGTPTPLGTFYEVSLMTTDFDVSVAWWQKAGFSITYGNPATDNFITLSDDMIRVGLYRPGSCPHIFNNPAVTYFDSDMAGKITAARELGILYAQEISNKDGVVSDAIVETEEGWHVFLFSA